MAVRRVPVSTAPSWFRRNSALSPVDSEILEWRSTHYPLEVRTTYRKPVEDYREKIARYTPAVKIMYLISHVNIFTWSLRSIKICCHCLWRSIIGIQFSKKCTIFVSTGSSRTASRWGRANSLIINSAQRAPINLGSLWSRSRWWWWCPWRLNIANTFPIHNSTLQTIAFELKKVRL